MDINTETIQVLQADELSNEDYHQHPFVSGSALATIHESCPAVYKYREQEDTPALVFGTQVHAAVLEPARFDLDYCRGLEKADYPDALTSDAAIKAKLKELGIAGYSNKKTPQLIEMLKQADPKAQVFAEIAANHEQQHAGREIIKPADYDKIMQMRRVIMADPDYSAALSGGAAELSLLAALGDGNEEWRGVKVRPDYITTSGGIWDYKSCVSCHPDDFMLASFKRGYWLKMAFQADVFEAVYGHPPSEVVLLAQEKTDPYIVQAYKLTDNQLSIGRCQYQQALNMYFRCMETDCWPAYGGGVSEMQTAAWIERLYEGVE